MTSELEAEDGVLSVFWETRDWEMPADTRLTLDSSESAELNSKVVFTSSSSADTFRGFVVSVSVLQIVTFLQQKWKGLRLCFSVCQKYIIPFSAVNLVEVWSAFGRIS